METYDKQSSNNNNTSIQNNNNMDFSIIPNSEDKTEILSIFSECEEVKGSDEGGINYMLSHKKPYASRMVMSNKKKYYQERVSNNI